MKCRKPAEKGFTECRSCAEARREYQNVRRQKVKGKGKRHIRGYLCSDS